MRKHEIMCDVLIWISALASGLYLSYILGIDHGFWGFLVGAGLGFAAVVTIASMLSKLACRNRK